MVKVLNFILAKVTSIALPKNAVYFICHETKNIEQNSQNYNTFILLYCFMFVTVSVGPRCHVDWLVWFWGIKQL